MHYAPAHDLSDITFRREEALVRYGRKAALDAGVVVDGRSTILEELVRLILNRDKDEMLCRRDRHCAI